MDICYCVKKFTTIAKNSSVHAHIHLRMLTVPNSEAEKFKNFHMTHKVMDILPMVTYKPRIVVEGHFTPLPITMCYDTCSVMETPNLSKAMRHPWRY